MAFLNPRKQQRAREASAWRRIAAELGLPATTSRRELAIAYGSRLHTSAVARSAWDAADRAAERESIERRVGILVVLRSGVLALARRADRLPPGSRRLAPAEVAAALERGARCVVVGHFGLTSPPLHPDTFRTIAGPLLAASCRP